MKRTPEQLRATRAKRALNRFNRRAMSVPNDFPVNVADALELGAATVELYTPNGAQSQPRFPLTNNGDVDVPAVARVLRLARERLKGTRLVIIDDASMLTRTVEFLDWARDNADDETMVEDVRGLCPGEAIRVGGGASPSFTIVRLAKDIA